MKIRKYLILAILSFPVNFILHSSSADTTSIIDNIYNFDFLKANEKLLLLSENEPLKYQTLNLEVKWWMAMERQDKDRFSEFLKTLDRFEKYNPSELSLIISSTYRMRYYACTNKVYMIPGLFLKVHRQVGSAEKEILISSCTEEKELFVLYKSLLELVQNSYSVSCLFSGHDINNRLIGDIESIINNGSYSNRTIGKYFLMKYYLDIENNKSKALAYLTELNGQYPRNLIFSQLLTNK
ncbi:MAG: hypothetical protein IPH69_12405 [Bacteroidales bacterium]|nr:hypothetical protein [Bacteroidales bacterium]